MARYVFVCGDGGLGFVAIPSQGVVRAPDCKNGTGAWVDFDDEVRGGVEDYVASNPFSLAAFVDAQIVGYNTNNPPLDVAAIDSRIAAYLEANPPQSPTGAVVLDPAAMGEAWGAGFVAAATGLVMIWAARAVLQSISVAAKS